MLFSKPGVACSFRTYLSHVPFQFPSSYQSVYVTAIPEGCRACAATVDANAGRVFRFRGLTQVFGRLSRPSRFPRRDFCRPLILVACNNIQEAALICATNITMSVEPLCSRGHIISLEAFLNLFQLDSVSRSRKNQVSNLLIFMSIVNTQLFPGYRLRGCSDPTLCAAKKKKKNLLHNNINCIISSVRVLPLSEASMLQPPSY
jgi:hypothetical protein